MMNAKRRDKRKRQRTFQPTRAHNRKQRDEFIKCDCNIVSSDNKARGMNAQMNARIGMNDVAAEFECNAFATVNDRQRIRAQNEHEVKEKNPHKTDII